MLHWTMPMSAGSINCCGEMSETTQIVLITHNKRTMEVADTLYGVTMQEPGVSTMVSVRVS